MRPVPDELAEKANKELLFFACGYGPPLGIRDGAYFTRPRSQQLSEPFATRYSVSPVDFPGQTALCPSNPVESS